MKDIYLLLSVLSAAISTGMFSMPSNTKLPAQFHKLKYPTTITQKAAKRPVKKRPVKIYSVRN
jgi:ABC-type thiamine transport system substrate-binding protein